MRALRSPGIVLALTCLVAAAAWPAGCKVTAQATSGQTGAGGAGGDGGGCPMGPPEALFTITVTSEDDERILPPDTTVTVRWSAGEEPAFVLGDPATWKTLEDGSNLVCDVDHDQPAPTDLTELHCELWTAGATEVEIQAEGYLDYLDTLTPLEKEDCDLPVPSEHELPLETDPEAG